MISAFADHFKPPMIKGFPAMPQWRIKADASWGGNTIYNDVSFVNFKTGKTFCGPIQRLFVANPLSADYNPKILLSNPIFDVSTQFYKL